MSESVALNQPLLQEKQRVTKTLSEQVEAYTAYLLKTADDQTLTNLYDQVLQKIETAMLDIVMKRFNGNQSKAAQALGLSRGTLRSRLKRYGLL